MSDVPGTVGPTCDSRQMREAQRIGSGGRTWVELERPKPPRVDDCYLHWSDPPPELSARCAYWLRQIEAGWRPNQRLLRESYDTSAHWYGVYIWEYLNRISPALD